MSNGPSWCPLLSAAGARGLVLVLVLSSCTTYRSGGRLTPDAMVHVILVEPHPLRALTTRDTIMLPATPTLDGSIMIATSDSLQMRLNGATAVQLFGQEQPATGALVWLARSELSKVETRRLNAAGTAGVAVGAAAVIVVVLGALAPALALGAPAAY